MQPLIVVSSKTGNTRIIARALQDAFENVLFIEAEYLPSDLAGIDPVVLCFWCDKGEAPEEMKRAAARLEGKRIACFATLGGDPESDKAREWMHRTATDLVARGRNNTLVAEFLCRGRIDPALFERMSAAAGGVTPEREARRKLSETHPDRLDTLNAVEALSRAFPELKRRD